MNRDPAMVAGGVRAVANASAARLAGSLTRWLAENGWTFDGTDYRGMLRSPRGEWQGLVRHRNGQTLVYVKDPPRQVFNGRYAPCFSAAGDGWFLINQPVKVEGIAENICGAGIFLGLQVPRGSARTHR